MENNSDYKYAKTFALFLNEILLVDLIRMITTNLLIINVIQYTLYIYCAFYTYRIIIVVNNFMLNKTLVVLLSSIFLIIYISYIICPTIKIFFGYFIPFLVIRIIPALYFTVNIDEKKIKLLFIILSKYRLIWMLYAIVGLFWIPLNTTNHYSMTFGYNLLIPSCIIFYNYIRYKKLDWFLYGIIFFICILLRASRASCICLIVFIMLTYIMVENENVKSTKKKTRIIILLTFIILVLINFRNITTLLSYIFPSSRTIALMSKNISFDSGRNKIKHVYLESIKIQPLKFNGIFSDRIYYANMMKSKYSITDYPHNFLIELFYQFGLLLGVTIFIVLLFKIIKSIKICKRKKYIELLALTLIMFVSGFLKLFFSASYLINVEFYLLIGIIIYIQKIN